MCVFSVYIGVCNNFLINELLPGLSVGVIHSRNSHSAV